MQLNPGRSAVNMLKTAAVILTVIAVCLLWGEVVRDAAGILFGGIILAFLLSPISRLLEKKLSRGPAALISIIGVCLVLTAAVILLLPLLLRQFAGLADLLPEAFMRLRGLLENLARWLERRMPDLSLPQPNLSAMESGLGNFARGAVQTVSGLADSLYRIFLMAALSYFLLSDRDRILLRAEWLVPSRWRRLAVRAGNMLLRELRLYLRGQATIALAVGALAGLGLALIGVPGSPLLALFVGLFNVIPYFGPLLGGIPAVITALSVSWQKAAFTLGLLFLVQQIDGMVISPRVMGNITGFSPAVVLIALFVGARIGSIGGMLLALPTLMAVRTLYRVFVQRHENN